LDITPHELGIMIVGIFIALLIIVLVGLIVAFIVSKKFRDYLSDDRPKPGQTFPIYTKQDPQDVFYQELYDIWVGRIADIVSNIRGGKNAIGRAHYLSVLLWILIIVIACLYQMLYISYFWQLALVIFFFTCFYSSLYSGWAPPRYKF
jgi:hypothetical protein